MSMSLYPCSHSFCDRCICINKLAKKECPRCNVEFKDKKPNYDLAEASSESADNFKKFVSEFDNNYAEHYYDKSIINPFLPVNTVSNIGVLNLNNIESNTAPNSLEVLKVLSVQFTYGI